MIKRLTTTDATYTGRTAWSTAWDHVLQYRVLCPDGKYRRTAYLAESADTFFSRRAAIRIGGKYVAGFVHSVDGVLTFAEYTGS